MSNDSLTQQKCINSDCEYSGYVGFNNYCSVCFKKKKMKSTKETTMTENVVAETILSIQKEDIPLKNTLKSSEEISAVDSNKVQVDKCRCFKCNRKVGLLGFNCKCGFSFCSSHRFPEHHDCQFDHAQLDKTKLAEMNKVIQPKKVEIL